MRYMDADTIANFIKPLGRIDFDAVVCLLLTKCFHSKVSNVDGKGDHGADWRVFTDSGGATTAVFQVTVQQAGWKDKVVADAKKAVSRLGATRYYFLTSRAHDSGELRVVEDRISSELQIPATCLGANEIADLLVRAKLVPALLDAIQVPVSINLQQRLDRKEILLHAYVTLGSDAADLRSSVYDDTLILALREVAQPLSRPQLVDKASQLLECSEATKVKLDRRVDSLLVRGHLSFDKPSGSYRLSADALEKVNTAERLYCTEFEVLAAAQQMLLRDRSGIEWTIEDARNAALLLARAFIQRQLDGAKASSLELTSIGLTHNIGDAIQDLRDLLKKRGVRIPQVNSILGAMVQQAQGLPLINKLARAAVFVAVEGSPPLSGARAIGANDWGSVHCSLDASVAIPYLCSRRYSPTTGRFSVGAIASVGDLLALGATVSIPGPYLDECASHLLGALKYLNLDRFARDLCHSENGFVAHYYELRLGGIRVPEDLMRYLATFSQAINTPRAERREWVWRIMGDLQQLLHGYGIIHETIGQVRQHIRDDVETTYAFKMREIGRAKLSVLVDHDVTVLSYLRQCVKEGPQTRLCLTWDKVMIGAGRELTDAGWIVSPHEAADFVQPFKPLGSAKLIALAHSLAGINDRPRIAAAQIVDTVVRLAKDNLQDWEFQEKIDKLKKDLLDRIDFGDPAYRDRIEEETERFLIEQGVAIRKNNEVVGEASLRDDAD